MPEQLEEKYSVIAAEESLPDIKLTAAIISSFENIPMDDAARRARHAWGFIGEGLAAIDADRLLENCDAFGLKVLKIPTAKLSLAESSKIKKISFESGKLIYESSALREESSLSEIIVLAVAPVKETSSITVKTAEGPSANERAIRFGIMAVTGLPIGLGKSKEVSKEIKTSETVFYLDILLKSGRRLSVVSNDFDFSCLKEKKTYSSQLNLRLLALELAGLATKALRNAGLLAIQKNQSLSALAYDTMDDFKKETLRLFALAKN